MEELRKEIDAADAAEGAELPSAPKIGEVFSSHASAEEKSKEEDSTGLVFENLERDDDSQPWKSDR